MKSESFSSKFFIFFFSSLSLSSSSSLPFPLVPSFILSMVSGRNKFFFLFSFEKNFLLKCIKNRNVRQSASHDQIHHRSAPNEETIYMHHRHIGVLVCVFSLLICSMNGRQPVVMDLYERDLYM